MASPNPIDEEPQKLEVKSVGDERAGEKKDKKDKKRKAEENPVSFEKQFSSITVLTCVFRLKLDLLTKKPKLRTNLRLSRPLPLPKRRRKRRRLRVRRGKLRTFR